MMLFHIVQFLKIIVTLFLIHREKSVTIKLRIQMKKTTVLTKQGFEITGYMD